MPEIKNTFTQGKMNKDLDERIIPNGQYRDAMNIQVSTSEGSDIGTVQNILGNTRVETVVGNDSKCVGSISNEKTNRLYWFIKNGNKDVILEFYQQEDNDICTPIFVDTKANTADAVLKFPDTIITGINIIDDLLLWTDNHNEPRKINISRSIQGTTDINTHTKLVVNNTVTANDVEEKHITVIRKRPLEIPTVVTDLVEEESEDVRLFEKDFIRFSTRYKYADGEYSAFGPFTDIIFKPGEFDIPLNETFNSGMTNSIKSIELQNFVPDNLPEDVVQVDLLYKQEDSSTIYSIDSITPADTEWNNGGSYIVSNENIRAALPSNQFLRVWDNVPKKALAQEVTGNRIVYANYTQGYDLEIPAQQRPEINVGYRLRDDITLDYGVSGTAGLPSIKSQRNYQLGVVYGDKYGRETPVFTSSNGSINIPWSGYEGLNSVKANQLTTELNGSVPSWAEYYKVFVKETSGDYFNLTMDKIYQNPVQGDITDEEQTIWMSFPSSDRNKIKEEDYIILKNKRSAGEQPLAVSQKNKFRVLDIKNEAPEAITYELQSIGTIASAVAADVFDDPNLIFNGHTGLKQVLSINITKWKENGGSEIESDIDRKEPMYFSFKNLDNGQRSKLYQISSVYDDGNNHYIVRLRNPISTSDNWATDASGVIDPSFELQVSIEKRVKKDLNEFTGRFFVKIASTEFTRTEIEPQVVSAVDASLVTTATATIKWHADTANAVGDYDHQTGILNYNGLLDKSNITDSGATVEDISGHSNNAVTDNPADWGNIGKGWFIDSMFVKAAQRTTSRSASASGRFFYGGGTMGVGDEDGNTLVNNYGVGYSAVGTADGSMMVNGMEGIIQTSDIHKTRDANGDVNYGARNILEFPTKKKGGVDYKAGASESQLVTLSNDIGGTRRNRTATYNPGGTQQDRYFIHLSFHKPGQNLHNGVLPSNLKNRSTNTDSDDLKNNMQDILVSGNWGTGSSTVHVKSWWYGPGDPDPESGGANFDPIEPDWEKVDNAWNPGYNSPENQRVIERLKQGQKFRFSSDTSDDPTVFTIKNNPKILRLYNHTSWHDTHVWDGNANNAAYQTFVSSDTGASVQLPNIPNTNIYLNGYNSVEYHAKNWENSDSSTNRNKLAVALKNFGSADNRRVCYIIEVDKDPTDSNLTFSLDENNINSLDTQVIEFVDDAHDSTGILSRNKVSIWETEPQKSVDLNIYYEATNAIPLKLTSENNITFAKPGDKFDLFAPAVDSDGNIIEDISVSNHSAVGLEPPSIAGWQGSNSLRVDNFLATNNASEWIGKPIGVPNPTNNPGVYYYDDYDSSYELYIKIYKEGSGFYTAKIIGHEIATQTVSFSSGGYNSSNVFLVSRFILAEENYNLPVGLNWFNCISFNNGIESNKIQDDFNGNKMTSGARANATLEEPYKEENRKSGLIYSGLYNSTSGVNDLNQFIMAEKITKDLNPTYGSIQKLFSRRVSLIAFCEDRVIGITANKDALYNADGNPQLVSSNAVLGDANPFVGDYGISQNPESFASESYRAYFTDKQRGAVLRLSMDGLTPISDAGMHDYFRDNLHTANRLIGSYDSHKQNYNLTLSDYLPLNLITNNKLEYGTEGTTIQLPQEEILQNTGFSGNPWVPPVNDPYASVLNPNSILETETVITDHAEIPADPPNTILPADYIPSTTNNVSNKILTPFHSGSTPIRDTIHPGHFHAASAFNTGVSLAKTQATTNYIAPFDTVANGSAPAASNYHYKWSHTYVQSQAPPGAHQSTGWYFHGSTDTQYGYRLNVSDHIEINLNNELNAHHKEVLAWKVRFVVPDYCLTNTANVSWYPIPQDIIDHINNGNAYISFSLQLVHGDNDLPIPSEYLISSGSGNGTWLDNFASESTVMHIDAIDLNNNSGHYDAWGWWQFRNTKGSNPPIQKIANGSASNWQEIDLPLVVDTNNNATANLVGLNGSFNSYGDGNCGVDQNGHLTLHDDDGTSITHSASINANGYYDQQAMPQTGVEAQSRVFGKVKLRIQAWFTDGSGTSIGPNQANSDGTADFYENHPIYVGNIGENQMVSYGIKHVSGHKYKWVEPIGFQADHPSYVVTDVATHGSGEDNYSISYAGQAEVVGQTAGSTQQYVPAWRQVEHSIVDNAWTPGTVDATFNPFTQAESDYGEATTVDPATLSPNVPAHANSPTSEADLSNGFTLNGDPNIPVGTTTQDDRFTISLGGSGQKDIQSVLTGVGGGLSTFVENDWYEIHISYNGGPLTNGSVILRDVLEPGLADGTLLDNHVGEYSGVGNPNTGGIKLVQHPLHNKLHARFQVHPNSQMVNSVNGGDLTKIRILFNAVSPDIVITKIELFDVSETGTGGTLKQANGHQWEMNPQSSIVNYYSVPSIYSTGNSVVWNNSTFTNEYLLQTWSSTGVPTPQANDDGYKLKFTISGYGGGELKGYVNNDLGDAGTNPSGYDMFEGFFFEKVDANGDYVITGNFDGSGGTMTRDGVEVTGAVSKSSDVMSNTSSSYDGKIVFSPAVTSGTTLQLSNVSLVDITNAFTSASVDAWNFTGFDSEKDNFINWDESNENIVFNNSPIDTVGLYLGGGSTDRIQIEQVITTKTFKDDSYNVKFDYNLTDGSISGYYFNKSGEGFRISSVTGNGTYDTTHIIGEANDKTADELSETFVLYVSSVSGSGLNGTLDNFFMQRQYVDFASTTISFSEDVTGWTSFKSFIPESGLNLSKKYYTIKHGRLFRHHENQTRNWFYGEQDANGDPLITESTITTVLNQEPSLVKIFNTLNYEGSQSKINAYEVDPSTNISNMEYYNLEQDKPGWYIKSIETDKQKGSISEFIEKEGKWFNYIRGDVNEIKTSDLSFQGLGIITNIS